jgi:ABC-type nitrate/sulfonate/bicarbonate transport system substrate-binding protein
MSVVATKIWLANDGAQAQFVEMPFASMAAAVERGTIAAAAIAQPFLSQLPPTVRSLANPLDAVAGHWAQSVWFTTAAWIERNAALAQLLTAATYNVGRWSNDHQSETAVALANASHLDVDKIKSSKRAIFSTARDSQPVGLSLAAGAKVGALSRPVTLAEIMASP